jgi:hypothetical protein
VKHLRAPAILIGALAVAGAAAAVALAANTAAFTASYAGTATEKVDGQQVTALAKGAGSGNLIGKGSITGTVVGNTSNPPCAPFGGPGVITGTKGKLNVTVLPSSQACAAGEDDRDNISLSGTVKVKSGTGKFAKSGGSSLHFSGHYDRQSGAFTVKLTGAIKV